jgi:hypothetical protein
MGQRQPDFEVRISRARRQLLRCGNYFGPLLLQVELVHFGIGRQHSRALGGCSHPTRCQHDQAENENESAPQQGS